MSKQDQQSLRIGQTWGSSSLPPYWGSSSFPLDQNMNCMVHGEIKQVSAHAQRKGLQQPRSGSSGKNSLEGARISAGCRHGAVGFRSYCEGLAKGKPVEYHHFFP